jgi:LmbE family N-acetylglucosaminyl deacetylase
LKLWVSPHSDDAVLFGAFTLLRERPTVLTVYDSYIQVNRGHKQCDLVTRRNEDIAAVRDVLGCPIQFAALNDAELISGAVLVALSKWKPSEVWLPAVEKDGHDQHNLIGYIGAEVFSGATIHRYLTYSRAKGKSTNGKQVPCTGAMVLKKLQALACYKTQIEIDALGCWPHFIRDQNEYIQ